MDVSAVAIGLRRTARSHECGTDSKQSNTEGDQRPGGWPSIRLGSNGCGRAKRFGAAPHAHGRGSGGRGDVLVAYADSAFGGSALELDDLR